jgi:hypothetical protein
MTWGGAMGATLVSVIGGVASTRTLLCSTPTNAPLQLTYREEAAAADMGRNHKFAASDAAGANHSIRDQGL